MSNRPAVNKWLPQDFGIAIRIEGKYVTSARIGLFRNGTDRWVYTFQGRTHPMERFVAKWKITVRT